MKENSRRRRRLVDVPYVCVRGMGFELNFQEPYTHIRLSSFEHTFSN